MVAGLAGILLVAAGAVALFITSNNVASLFALSIGILLVLVAWLGPRLQLESFELLGAKIRVREVVVRRLQLAEARDGGIVGDNGDALRRQAAALQTLYGLYRLYAHIRRTQPVGDQRTDSLDQLAERMQQAGMTTDFDPVEVASWFEEGDDGLRVVALEHHARSEGEPRSSGCIGSDRRAAEFVRAVLRPAPSGRDGAGSVRTREASSERLNRARQRQAPLQA